MPPSARWLFRWARATGLAGGILLCATSSCSLLFESQPVADAAIVTKEPDAAVVPATCPAHVACAVNWLSGPCGCYQYRSVPGGWQNSADLCFSNQGYPVEIDTKAENLWLNSVIPDRFWLGLEGSLVQNVEAWQWTRAASPLVQDEDYNGFLSGILPAIDTDFCANSMGGEWQSAACDELLPIVCEQTR